MLFKDNATVFAATAERSDNAPEVATIPNVFASNSLWKPLNEVTCCDFSKDGKLFAWSLGFGYVGVVKSNEEDNVDFDESFDGLKPCSRIIECGEHVTAMMFLPKVESYKNSYALLATGLKRGPIKIWNAITGIVSSILFDHTAKITGLTFSPNHIPLLVSSSHDKSLKVWDLGDNGNMCLTIKGHKQPINSCAYSPSKPDMIASVGNAREVFIWKLTNKRHACQPVQLHGHRNDVRCCAWSPDGALLATASNDSTVILWDVADKSKVITLGHRYPMPSSIYAGGANGFWVSCVAFSNDGRKLVTTCEDDRARIWHIYDGKVAVDEVPIPKLASKCVFSPNGRYAAVGQANGSVKVLCQDDIQIPSLAHFSRMAHRKSVTPDELQTTTKNLPFLLNQYLHYKS